LIAVAGLLTIGWTSPLVPREVVATLVNEMPLLDGRLDEALWQKAGLADGFIQREPREGEAAEQPTEVRIAYTERHLLIGARMRDSDPSRIVATEYRRDGLLDADDSFEVFLDTFHDRRNAFYFATNPAGAQRDGLVRNEGATLTWEWDGVWDVACNRDAQGWTAEMVIPFSTLRFRPDSEEGWGLNFGRLVARTREESYWAPITLDMGYFGKWRVSAFGALEGITEAVPGGRLKLKPYILGGAEHDLDDEPNDVDFERNVGIDAKVALGSTLVADLTVNTDFAQAESDQEQVNLTRFALFFPEKREFFLENAGLFQIGEQIQPMEPATTLLFFSRRIGLYDDEEPVPILGGARLTGRVGPYEIGAFDIVTSRTRIDEDTVVPQTNFAAARVKRDILSRSSIGGLLLAKSPADEGSSNQVVAADATIAFSENGVVNGFASKSFTPGLSGASHALGAIGSWENERGGAFGSFVDIGDDFNSEMGFLQRTGIRKYRGGAGLIRRPQFAGIRQFMFFNDHTYITEQNGELESQVNTLGPMIVFNNGAILMGGWMNLAEGLSEPFEIRDGVEIPIGSYRFNQAMMQYMGDRSRRVSVRGGFVYGGFFNGRLRSLNLGGRLKPHQRLSLEVDYFRNHILLPLEGGDFKTNLVVARAIVAFSPKAFVRALLQVNDDEEEARANILFRYTYRPGADLFVVYNEERGIGGVGPTVKNRQLLVKLTVYSST